MVLVQNFNEHSQRLIEPDLTIETRLQLIKEVRDSFEVTYSADYHKFLNCYMKPLLATMYQVTKPQFVQNTEHKIRYIVIDTLSRLPHIEVLRPFAQDLLRLALHVLVIDNEEIAALCVRIIFDVIRHFKPHSDDEIQKFADFVLQIYQNFRSNVTQIFLSGPASPPEISGWGSKSARSETNVSGSEPAVLDDAIIHPVEGEISPSTRSFKIVTECPLVVMYLFHSKVKPVQTLVPHLLPLMIDAISIRGPKEVPNHLMTQFADLQAAQVKTLSYLTYLLRSFTDYIRPHEESICKGIVNMLANCSHSIFVRKELLVCLKHVLNTDLRKGLFPFIDTLLDNSVLIGIDLKTFKTLRPLAYSLLVEIVHHIKWELSLPQLLRVIHLSSINMHNSSWPLNIHTTHARLMLNLVEPIFEKAVDHSTMEEARNLLGIFLDVFASKFSNFKQFILQDVLSFQEPVEHSKQVSDAKNLIKTLIMGVKAIIWTITNVHSPQSQVSPSRRSLSLQMLPSTSSSSVPRPFKGMKEDEVRKASYILKTAMDCLVLFKEKHEEREMIHLFSQIFTVMEPQDIMDIFSLCMPHIFNSMVYNIQIVHIFSNLQQSPASFKPSAEVLVNFLVRDKLDVLKQHDSSAATITLHLFRFIFGAVAKAPSSYECILQPHLHIIIESCMKCTTEDERPLGHLLLLRTVFRSLAGGKCELLMRGLIPKLHPCLNMLLAMLEGPIEEDLKDVVLELCLILPGRLSSLLSHLPRLMKPLVMCLKGKSDLVNLGLRTIEFWIDSLNPDFLELSMGNVIPEVICVLWSHLRPAPYLWGQRSLQILGKLGGRNRRFLREPLALECKENPEHGFRVLLTFEPSTQFSVPLDRCINLAVAAVKNKNSTMNLFHRKQALKFLCVCLSSLLNFPGKNIDESSTCRYLSTILVSPVESSLRKSETPDLKVDLGVKTRTQLIAQNSILKTLLSTIIATGTETGLYDTTDEYVGSVCHHFAILFHIENHSSNSSSAISSLVNSSSGKLGCYTSNLNKLDSTIFLDAIVDVLADENRNYAKAALSTLNMFVEAALFLACSKQTPVVASNTSVSAFGSSSPNIRFPEFDKLLPRLLHCCYGSTWQAQIGGVMGIAALIEKVPSNFFCPFHMSTVCGLVYVLKQLPLFARKEQEETSQVLMQVIRMLNVVDEVNSEACRKIREGVIEYLTTELFNTYTSTTAKNTVQSCILLLASSTGSEVSELLENLYQPLLQPLIERKLQSRTVNQQVGIVAALKFCISLRTPLLKMTNELVSVLEEALQIAETEEIVCVVKSMNPEMVASLIKLRAMSIELLSSSITREEFNSQNLSSLRARIISMFFKLLSSRTPEIVAAAREGLRQAIIQRRISKDDLQNNLRPILIDLKQMKNLSIPFLQRLAHLIELLSNFFNIALGGTLLLHLKNWLEPEKLAQCPKSWKAGEEEKIAAAILEIFHLLPSAASKFLVELIKATIDLEAALPPAQIYSKINSPYRLPLTKFLSRYPTAAVDYFLAHLTQPKYFECFMYVIKSDAGQPLRDELAKSPMKILFSAFPDFLSRLDASFANESSLSCTSLSINEGLVAPLDGSNLPATILGAVTDPYFEGLYLIKTLVKLLPNWLPNNRVVFDLLVLLWKSPVRTERLKKEPELTLVQAKESKWLVKCFLNYLRHDRTEFSVLYDMLSIFLYCTRMDFTFLKVFYINEVAEVYPPNMKKMLLIHFLDIFRSKELGQDHLVVIMQILISPMLVYTFQNGQLGEVVDPTIIESVVENILDRSEDVFTDYDEPVRIELLQLSSLFLKYLQNSLLQHRRKVFAFGWKHLKLEDCASKRWALVNVCYFFKSYNAPTKVILQVFAMLLRDCQPEYKMVVNQALDILMPVLPQRAPPDDCHIPHWIRCTKIILVEEGHSVLNIVHIFQLIDRHSYLFFKYRSLFIPLMVNSLSRLGLPSNTTIENRQLAIELAGLVVSWERKRQNEKKVPQEGDIPSQNGYELSRSCAGLDNRHPRDGNAVSENRPKGLTVECLSSDSSSLIPNSENTQSGGHPGEDFKLTAAMEEMITNFLIRVTCALEMTDKEESRIYKQALEILSEALEVWPCASVKLDYLENLLTSSQPTQSKDPTAALLQGLDMINKIFEKQPHFIIQNNINQIFQIAELCFKNKNIDVGKLFCSLLKMVCSAFPSEAASTPQGVKTLYTKVTDLVHKYLVSVATPQITNNEISAQTINFLLYIMKILAEVQDNLIKPYHVVQVLRCLAQEFRLATGSYDERRHQNSAPVSSQQSGDMGVTSANLKSALELIDEKIMLVPDYKQSVVEIISILLSETNTDYSVLFCLLDIIKEWIEKDSAAHRVTNKSCNILSPKEVVSFLQSLSKVEKKNFPPRFREEWERKYLQLLYELCSDTNKFPPSLCQKVFEDVERRFLLGLSAADPEMRMKFFSLYNASLGRSLFTRLQYIVHIQDWEAVSDIFWLKQGLDLLLAILVQDIPIMLAPNSAKVSPLVVSDSFTTSSMQSINIDVGQGFKDSPLTIASIVQKHTKFLSEMSQLQVADLVVPLKELAHTDANIAYCLWVLVFPIVWVTLHKDEQLVLAKPMIALLSKDYHKKQLARRPNVVQALLEGIHLSQPQLRLPSELIKHVGKTFNAWSIALDMLESHVMLLSNDSKCSECLDELYHLLHEEDMRYGLWRKRSVMVDTEAGLSLVQHGYWQHAQVLFCQAMGKATRGTCAVPKDEMCLWEEQWLYCSRQLGQWDALVEFGKLVENYDVLLGSLWKLADWRYLKDHVIPNAQVEETLKTHIIKAYISLHENNASGREDTDYVMGKGVNLALEQWWQLPDICFHSRIPLLQQFQQLVEIKESTRVIDIARGTKHPGSSSVGIQGRYAELKEILEIWRVRTPNKWDDMSVWYDFSHWRNEIYSAVIGAIKDFGATNTQRDYVGYREKAWNINKLACVARRQGSHDACASILDNMYRYSTMDVQEAFVKIREKLKAFLEMKGELINGLNLINSTNLNYFPVKQKAEIFRLKGDFLLRLNDSDGANIAYSNAISLCKNLPKGWISWGNYCDMAYKRKPDEIWLEYAVSCFLQGIKFGISNSRSHLARVFYLLSFDTPNKPVARAFNKYLDQIPHWVWLYWIPQLLVSLQRTEGPHCKLVLLKVAVLYPQALYYWLRTHLLELRNIVDKSDVGRMEMSQQRMQLNVSSSGSGSARPTDNIARAVSQDGGPLASENQIQQKSKSSGTVGIPNSGSSHMRESERSSAIQDSMYARNYQPWQQSSSTISETNLNASGHIDSLGLVASAANAYDAAKDIMETLRSKHTNLASELEILLTEIGSRFVTLPEERLFAVICAVLHHCYKHPTATTENVPECLRKELSNIGRVCFSADSLNKNVELVREYKQNFEHDLDPASIATFPSTLSELIERLKHWKNVVQTNLKERLPPVLKLEEESRVLCDFCAIDVEIPGQYFIDQEVAPNHTVKLDRIGANVQLGRRHGNSFRRLMLIGSDGSQRHFVIQTTLMANTRSDERIMQLFRAMNQMFNKHKESRRRHMCIHTPIIIPVWAQLCMVEDDPTYNTFLEVYEHYCSRTDRDADLPITYFKEQLNEAISGQISTGALIDLRLHAYNDIAQEIVNDSIFSQYMYKTLSNVSHMWAFKRQFTVQLALSCFLSFILQIGGRSPSKILFAKNSGKIFQADFRPVYDTNGMIDFNEPIPFRLTRNLQAFVSQFGVEGVVVSSIFSAAQAVVSPKQTQHMWHHLAMFFRDELLSWSWRRPMGLPLPPVNGGDYTNPTQFKQKISTNVELVTGRISSLAPNDISDEDYAVNTPQSIHSGVTKLVEAAMSPGNLCMMDPTWHPWF